MRIKFLIVVLCFSFVGIVNAQSKEQDALQRKRNDLLQEIKQIQLLLNEQTSEKKSVVTQVEGLNKKILVREKLNKVTNQQINLINSNLKNNQKTIKSLEDELKVLRGNYAEMIRKSYRNKSQQNRLMFILASETFFQAYKRMEYMRQFRAHLKKQGTIIQDKAKELQRLNQSLVTQRADKQELIEENKEIRTQLESERIKQQELITEIKKKEGSYLAKIKEKKQEADRLEQEIQRLIREAIAESRKKAAANGKKVSSSSNTFALTPEEEMIANNFAANKGKLIWPVERGVVSIGYGKYSDPVYPGLVQENSGVNIMVPEGEVARAIFEGEVIRITINRGKANVYLKDGNYISTYCNLDHLYVKKGDVIPAKQPIGTIFTSKYTGKTELKFLLYKNTIKLNPELWIYKM
ncbi:peptidase M23 [Neptunitalea chrysea]|uniref:Peptidase M23 n=1 Tax=Neptunitalea chrysea TaxID=1647581 RepID=A0A9W6B5E9_9FLAO|nr:peptidoglycan DD-metalloendopeptidase family protein [Neptunitalea chrysea]GLB52856.1 peptidase M23 [Neptunitalea chrysea]